MRLLDDERALEEEKRVYSVGLQMDGSDMEEGLSCERMAEALSNWEIAVYDHNHVTGEVYVSSRFRELYGFGPDEDVHLRAISECVHPADRVAGSHAVMKAHDPRGDGKFDLLYRIVRLDGEVRWVRSRSTTTFGLVDGKLAPLRTLGSVQDMTKHQELELAVQRQSIRLEQAVSTSAVGIFELDHRPSYPESRVYLSPTFTQLTGIEGELSGDFRQYLQRVHKEDLEKVRAAFSDLLALDGPEQIEVEHRFVVAEGEVRWFLLRASSTFERKEPTPGPLLSVGAIVDLTSSQRARTELAERSAILDATPDFVCIAKPGGELVYLNRAARQFMGLKPDEDECTRNMEEVHPPEVVDFIRREALPIARREGAWRGETVFVDHLGREVPMSQVILAHSGGRAGELRFSTIARDLTKEKELEAQVHQAQKMEAVGQLAGGVAHDFNNLLSVILGFTELGAKHLESKHPASRSFREIRVASERASALTNQLLAFSRRQIIQPRVIDVGALISEVTPILRRALSEVIEFSVVGPPQPLRIKADPSQIEQILLNLVVNARDAMDAGGRLTIELSSFNHDPKRAVTPLELAAGEYVVTSVTDTGHGMDASCSARIFEPFFTTKEPGKGTGLGLSTVFGIVRQNRGAISVSSEKGVGTRFDVYLPRSREPATEYLVEERPLVQLGRATVLLAEDDVQVRQMTAAVLEEAGLLVIDASSPLEALKIAETFEGPIELLLTDVMMPHMSGRELAEKVLILRPQIQVIYMSGYTRDSIVRKGVLDEGIRFLPKPISGQILLETIRDTLSR